MGTPVPAGKQMSASLKDRLKRCGRSFKSPVLPCSKRQRVEQPASPVLCKAPMKLGIDSTGCFSSVAEGEVCPPATGQRSRKAEDTAQELGSDSHLAPKQHPSLSPTTSHEICGIARLSRDSESLGSCVAHHLTSEQGIGIGQCPTSVDEMPILHRESHEAPAQDIQLTMPMLPKDGAEFSASNEVATNVPSSSESNASLLCGASASIDDNQAVPNLNSDSVTQQPPRENIASPQSAESSCCNTPVWSTGTDLSAETATLSAQPDGTHERLSEAPCKRKLQERITKKEETLRKLLMVKMYRSKNNLDDLQVLIDKWRCASQEAAQRLWQLAPEPRPTLTQMLGHCQIEHDLIGFNPEEETFM